MTWKETLLRLVRRIRRKSGRSPADLVFARFRSGGTPREQQRRRGEKETGRRFPTASHVLELLGPKLRTEGKKTRLKRICKGSSYRREVAVGGNLGVS
ncbi:hypothetical protein U1Q18_001437 [Sarracenia purpurea var. burkii]